MAGEKAELIICRSFGKLFLLTCLVLSQSRLVFNLTCFDCEEEFENVYYVTDCETRVNETFTTRECQENENWCKVERTEVNGVVKNFIRDCAEECNYGCKVMGFGVSETVCTTCCQEDGCNTGNGAASSQTSSNWNQIFFSTIAIFSGHCTKLLH